MSRFSEILDDKKFMGGLYVITLITALLILVLVIKGPEQSGRLIVDDNGKIIGIHRARMSASEHYDMTINIKEEEGDIQRDVDLTLQPEANRSGSGSAKMLKKDEKEAAIDAAIDRIVSEIEYSGKERIMLPETLPDGTAIEWLSSDDRSDNGILIVLIMYPLLVGLVIASRFKEKDTGKAERQAILRGLPRFCNQLFLMMNAGLILSDAFDTITGSYAGFERDDLSNFEKDLADLKDATDNHRISTAEVINDYAVRHDVKEMIRIATILTENEKRGSDVIESLARESRYLWDERKVVARECGKMIDSRMSYPLGLLLIVLIVITMAPALLNM